MFLPAKAERSDRIKRRGRRKREFTRAARVTITRADGSVETQPPYTPREYLEVVRQGKRVRRQRARARAKARKQALSGGSLTAGAGTHSWPTPGTDSTD